MTLLLYYSMIFRKITRLHLCTQNKICFRIRDEVRSGVHEDTIHTQNANKQRNGSCLTWSLTPHSPLPGFSRGLTPKLCHARRRVCARFTWVPLPIAGLDFQPQTQPPSPTKRISYFSGIVNAPRTPGNISLMLLSV